MSSLQTSLFFFIVFGVASFSFVEIDAPQARLHSRTADGNDSISVGKQLAMRHCGSCHLVPEPALLDKKTWVAGVLPNMAMRLGIKLPGQDTLKPLSPEEEKAVGRLNIYPETALLSADEWAEIVRYYEHLAPAEPLPQKPYQPLTNQLPLFKAREIALGDKPVPQTTLLKYDKFTSQLYVGDAQNALYVLGNPLQAGDAFLNDTWWIDTAPTDIDFPKNAAPRLLTIGIFSPSDQHLGRLMTLERAAKPGTSPINIRDLPRPVQFATGDLNADGKEDVIICGFGNNAGKLFWYDGFEPTKEHVLKALPGARKVEIADFNRDKKPDIMVVMAQAREEVVIFYNQGNGRFKEKTVLQFSPLFGASYFELADFNQDGFQDILLTNGDNWDYSSVNKNYHGVRIYLNDRKDNFKEAWFYPLYGASKAIARDFDQDGDLDIAATSFYSNLAQPEQGFVYLSNEGRLNFKPFTTTEGAHGKWLTMEAADFDKDGDVDLVLGSYFHTVGEMTQLIFKGILSFPQLLVLENRKR
ncbi:FG-GAP repeat domain-containing protein [Larkinella humicola]|uniref:VCBS repeat-containing protein n=1 Tax=Larkinella humicola TaxID=2607654 RepID=A0A5N1J8F5_9BACT|nr:VCBS repeat-containing protein [Larkinella humicola]KAA9347759.1 VCBS repeat-containing protein [Larkinella humicola]